MEKRIIISPVGGINNSIIESIGKEIKNIFGFDIEILPMQDDLQFAFDPSREQYFSTVILEELTRKAPENALKILAVTNIDLFIPILTHVYGEAQLGGMSCIISLFRLQEGLTPLNLHDAFSRRITKEAIHEIGHTFNLRHCSDHSCIMHYCHNIIDVDRKSDNFCRYCNILLDDEIKNIV